MKLTIDVTQEDIDLGCRLDLDGIKGGCMVYRAFNRCTEGSFPFFAVEYLAIRIYDSYDSKNEGILSVKDIPLPDFVYNAIDDFDRGDYVAPFSFEIEIPQE